jgi:ornithine carbamoyltransferase
MAKIEMTAAKKSAQVRSQRMAPPTAPSIIADVIDEHALRGRDILGIETLSKEEILLILDVARRLKLAKFDSTQTSFAKGQTLAMLFEKPSLRTRVTFEAGMTQLGGSAINIEGKLGIRETVPDVARNLDRWIDGIMARVFEHSTVVELAENAVIPVVNGLSDLEHPCQALADFQTLQEARLSTVPMPFTRLFGRRWDKKRNLPGVPSTSPASKSTQPFSSMPKRMQL